MAEAEDSWMRCFLSPQRRKVTAHPCAKALRWAQAPHTAVHNSLAHGARHLCGSAPPSCGLYHEQNEHYTINQTTDMKDITIEVPVEHYIYQWVSHTVGLPIRFPKRSAENALLIQLLKKRPPSNPTANPRGLPKVSIVIPDNRAKAPEYYHYLDHRGESEVRNVLARMFRIALWAECCSLVCCRWGVNGGIDNWCRRNGIAIEYREAVRQKFYRMRRSYIDHGIALLQLNRRQMQAFTTSRAGN